MNKVKIVVTIGPASANAEVLVKLKSEGMSIARLNGSHATLDWHRQTIQLIQQTLPDVPILLDIPGRKIRTINLVHEPKFGQGDSIILTTDMTPTSGKYPVNYDLLHESLKSGDIIFADDGTLRFKVLEVRGRDIHCQAENSGQLRSRKGINVPYVELKRETVTERDISIIGFAKECGVDMIGISFVDSAQHVKDVRDIIGTAFPKIVAKVENQAGVDRLLEIVQAADAIMIDRGDLSVETELETVILQQKQIISAARVEAKPVIVATEMLHSMMENPFPTKAEVSDVTNAVLDGASAVMLSGETAIGRFPVESVGLMRRVGRAACTQWEMQDTKANATPNRSIPDAIQQSALMLCQSLPITKIVAITRSGFAAMRLASGMPRQPILAVTNDRQAARVFNLFPGTEGVFIDVEFQRTGTDHITHCLKQLWCENRILDDDFILVISLVYPHSGNRMNLLEVHRVRDLCATLDWQK